MAFSIKSPNVRPTSAPPVPDPDPDSNTAATRHLSAGAYLDPQFCLSALREVYYQPKRVVAPSYGFDSIVVFGHCLRARRAMVIRDATLVGLLLVAAVVSFVAVPVALATLWAVHVAVTTVRACGDAIRYLRDTPIERTLADIETRQTFPRSTADRQRQEGRTGTHGLRRLWLENVVAQVVSRVLGLTITYLWLLGAATAVAVLTWRWGPPQHGRFGLPAALGVPSLVGFAFLVPAGTRAWSRRQLRAFVPGSRPERPVRTRRLAEIEQQSRGNTVVYSGHRPFVGSGTVLRRWDIAQRLVRPLPDDVLGKVAGATAKQTEKAREFTIPPFTAKEISDYVRSYIAALANDPVPEWQLPDLQVTERILVAGTEINDLRPYTDPDKIERILRRPTAPQRHYLSCQVVSWGGELVTTVYVHFAVQGKALYMELDVTGLLPCDSRFRVVDEVGGTGIRHVLRAAASEMLAAPAALAAAPTAVVRALSDRLSLSLTDQKTDTKVKKGYDYGALVGVRELGTSAKARDPMQIQDIQKYSRVIERRVLASILDFLEDKGVDVTEYRANATTILNAGAVAGPGGTVTVHGDAVGSQTNTTGQGAN